MYYPLKWSLIDYTCIIKKDVLVLIQIYFNNNVIYSTVSYILLITEAYGLQEQRQVFNIDDKIKQNALPVS